MAGMRRVPDDIHREVLTRVARAHGGSEPTWYAVWWGVPHAEDSVLLGRTERLNRARWWRAYPVTGEFPRPVRGWVNIIAWFLELHRGHEATTDTCTATETEQVEEKWG